jgi:Putative transposase
MTRWLRRRALLEERPAEARSNEPREPSPLEACMQMSLFGGVFLRLESDGTPVPVEEERFGIGAKSPWAAEAAGFNIHAGVTVRAGDREGLERLCRYGARPPLSLERLSILADGRVAYRLRKSRRNGATHLVLEPLVFMARLASLIPPPRFPFLRLAGVFAPSSSWRAAVVPPGPAASGAAHAPPRKKTTKTKDRSTAASPSLPDHHDAPAARSAETSVPAGPRTSLGTGVRPSVGARIDWASLIRRIYLEDILACPCGGRRRVVADVSEHDVVVAILDALGLPSCPPPIARARSPGFEAA